MRGHSPALHEHHPLPSPDGDGGYGAHNLSFSSAKSEKLERGYGAHNLSHNLSFSSVKSEKNDEEYGAQNQAKLTVSSPSALFTCNVRTTT